MEQEHDRIYRQNEDQYDKIHQNSREIAMLKAELREIKADLIGVTGQNGLRGEIKSMKLESTEREKRIMESLNDLAEKQSAMLKWVVGLLLGAPAVVAAILKVMEAV